MRFWALVSLSVTALAAPREARATACCGEASGLGDRLLNAEIAVSVRLMTRGRFGSFGEPTLLIVDDDLSFRTALGGALQKRGFAVTLAKDAIEAENAAQTNVFEYAVVDVRMPGPSGIELVERLIAIDEGTRIVVLTGYGTIANAVTAMRNGAVDYLTKPADAETVERALLGTRAEAGTTEIPSLERIEWEYMQRVLADSGGNVSDAARKLRVHRRTLQRKLARNAPRQ